MALYQGMKCLEPMAESKELAPHVQLRIKNQQFRSCGMRVNACRAYSMDWSLSMIAGDQYKLQKSESILSSYYLAFVQEIFNRPTPECCSILVVLERQNIKKRSG